MTDSLAYSFYFFLRLLCLGKCQTRFLQRCHKESATGVLPIRFSKSRYFEIQTAGDAICVMSPKEGPSSTLGGLF